MIRKKGRRLDDIYGIKSDVSDEEEIGTGFRHSSYFHNYYRGYTEVRTETEGGKYKFQRVYTQPWIVENRTDLEYYYYRSLYLAMLFVAMLLHVKAMMISTVPETSSRLVGIPGMMATAFFILTAYAAFEYLILRRRMTLYDRDFCPRRLIVTSIITAADLAVTVLLSLVYILINGPSNLMMELIFSGMLIAAALLLAAIAYMVSKTSYIEEENDTGLPEGEVHEVW